MNGWTITGVWDVNGKLVVAKTITDAINVYNKFSKDTEIYTIHKFSGSVSDYDAIIEENQNNE